MLFHSMLLLFLKTCIVVVSLVGPVVRRAVPSERNGRYTLKAFDPILDRCDKAQRRPMVLLKRPAVHLVAKQCLRVHHAWHVDSNKVLPVGSNKTDKLGPLRARRVHGNKIAE